MNTTINTVDSPVGEIRIFKLTNRQGASVELSSLGAGVLSIVVPDRDGHLDDVVLGYDNILDYIGDGPCAGKIPGRYANRIAKGYFEIDGIGYNLAVNCGPNHLHGGPGGFMNRNWEARLIDECTVEFTYKSIDGEEGYPGNLTATATYHWTDSDQLTLDLKAVADKKTVVNLTNHCYFNLDGQSSGSALGHRLRLNASRCLHTDAALTPTGILDDVAGTPMDFTSIKQVGKDIDADFEPLRNGKGYDHCWVIDSGSASGEMVEAAHLEAERSGRVLDISTTQPAVQVYTGNWLTGSPTGKGGVEYHDYDAVAIECQGFPDAPNHKNFPSQLLLPGDIYHQVISFRFSVLP